MKILAQNVSTTEVRTVMMHCTMDNIPFNRASIDSIIPESNIVPVGSVEFVSKYMELANITYPTFDCYPHELSQYMTRHRYVMYASEALQWGEDCFVKPVKLKLFNGFIRKRDGQYDEHDQEQFDILKSNPDELVYVSDIVKFQSEWRYYISQNKVMGAGRYDPDGEDDALVPDQSIVQEAVDIMFKSGFNYYTLDFGVLDTGETELVEANDAWAIGLYEKALTPKVYTEWLANRWKEISKNSLAS